jgi:aminoglycoside phosphotransferase (APT) family kinase protein
MTISEYTHDRLLAIKHSFGEMPLERFDIRDDRQCAYRVLCNLLVEEEVARESGRAVLPERIDLQAAIPAELSGADETERHLRRRAAQLDLDRIADVESRYRELLAQQPPAPAPAALTFDFDALGRCLERDHPDFAAVVVRPLQVVNGGYSKVTVICSLESGGAPPSQIVVRLDGEFAFAGTSVLDEYPVVRAMHQAGIAVPRPLWAGRVSENSLPAMISEKAAGEPFGSPTVAAVRSEAICRDMGRHLARVHRAPADPLLARRGQLQSNITQVRQELEHKALALRRTGETSPVADYALAWLHEHLHFVQERQTVVHGDYGPQNLLAADGAITAILDWEFVRIGNPVEDLCFPRLAVEQLGDFQMFVDSYVEGGGEPPEDKELLFFTVLGLTRLCIMMLQTNALFAASETKAIRIATPGAERIRPILLRLGRLLAL